MIGLLLAFSVSAPSSHAMNLPPTAIASPGAASAPQSDADARRERVRDYEKAMKALAKELQAAKAADGGQLSEARQREFLARVNAINESFGVRLAAPPPPPVPTPR